MDVKKTYLKVARDRRMSFLVEHLSCDILVLYETFYASIYESLGKYLRGDLREACALDCAVALASEFVPEENK